MNFPEYVEIENTKYKINTDFRNAIKCNEIAEDNTIGDCERALAIIFVLFGDEGLNATKHHSELIKLAEKFLKCGKERELEKTEKRDMDFIEDYNYIEASFMSDYKIDLSNTHMHWWKFMNLIEGLSNSEMGNCCVLNRIRNLRNFNLAEIKDSKEREKVRKMKNAVELKKNKKKANREQEQSARDFYKEFLRKE